MPSENLLERLVSDPLIVARMRRRAERSRWTAEDLIDESSLRLLMKRKSELEELRNPGGYLLRIAEHVIRSTDPISLNRKRTTRRETAVGELGFEDAPQYDCDLPGLIEEIEQSLDQRGRAVLDALRLVPPGRSPVPHVAAALGVSLPTARKQVRRTVQTLRRQLIDYR
jgi:DNA-directed RNA polymerase specialized sigma24 family protein